MLDDAQKTPETVYTRDTSGDSDVMTVAQYYEYVALGLFTDDDGHGYPALGGKMSRSSTIPSKVNELPGDATHIVWFNR